MNLLAIFSEYLGKQYNRPPTKWEPQPKKKVLWSGRGSVPGTTPESKLPKSHEWWRFGQPKSSFRKLLKGGPGSGRKPKDPSSPRYLEHRRTKGAVREAIRGYARERTPGAYQRVVEAFRHRERKPEKPWFYGMRHPMD